ncbi:hypothetical protein AMECASPLE_022707 [Ameca splendens]|uniref:Uncharacterized protein n=1 Tax=Ameca splendens TaxID=208324 RepID=A0ABV0ZQW9_9TELE
MVWWDGEVKLQRGSEEDAGLHTLGLLDWRVCIGGMSGSRIGCHICHSGHRPDRMTAVTKETGEQRRRMPPQGDTHPLPQTGLMMGCVGILSYLCVQTCLFVPTLCSVALIG